MPSKIFRHVFASPQPKVPPPPISPKSYPLSFPLWVHLTIDQLNGLLSGEYVLDVKLGDAAQNAKWVDLEHTNVVERKFIVDPRVRAKMDESPSFAEHVQQLPLWREVSIRLTISQRNGLLTEPPGHFLAVKLLHARPKSIFGRVFAPAKFVDLEHELDLFPWKGLRAPLPPP